MAKNIRKNFTIRLTDAEREALTKESGMLGMSPTEYIRVLMQHGKSRLYIEYLALRQIEWVGFTMQRSSCVPNRS